jgi:exonuclease SbcD
VLVVEIEPQQEAKVREVELKQCKKLFRKRAEGMQEALVWLAENHNSLVELTLVTDTYLTAMERKSLAAAHNGIIAIIPEVRGGIELNQAKSKNIDLTKSMDELFADYFRHKKGQEPNDEILNLFTEIMAEEDER